MKIEDVYLGCKLRVESNVTNGGVALDKPRFVDLFNASQIKFIDDCLKRKNDDSIRDIDILLRRDVRLEKTGKTLGKAMFKKPKDLYSYINVRGEAVRGKCVADDFLLWEAKPENVHELLTDEYNKPSFKYRETFYTIGGDGIAAYTDGFDIRAIYMTYYRNPVQVDIEGIVREGGVSSSIDPEFADRVVVRIMDILVKEFDKNEFQTDRYSVDKQEVYTAK
jgi:hypothetical protein